MKSVLKPIFELITGEFTLFDNNIVYNYIAMGVIGVLALKIAFWLVGKVYDSGIISGREAGSFLHWPIRLFVFAVLFYIFSLVIWLIKFIMAVPLWVWWIAGAVVLLIIMLIIIFKIKSYLSTKNSKNKEEE